MHSGGFIHTLQSKVDVAPSPRAGAPVYVLSTRRWVSHWHDPSCYPRGHLQWAALSRQDSNPVYPAVTKWSTTSVKALQRHSFLVFWARGAKFTSAAIAEGLGTLPSFCGAGAVMSGPDERQERLPTWASALSLAPYS